MIWAFEIGLALWAIYVLIVGYHGKPAKLPAVVALLPAPLSFLVLSVFVPTFVFTPESHFTLEQWTMCVGIVGFAVPLSCGLGCWYILRRRQTSESGLSEP
jgi:drug/metabolite transporter (DMT)-like permease